MSPHLSSLNLSEGSVSQMRDQVRSHFNNTWKANEQLFETLANDDVFYQQPQPLRHPLVFYFGHTAVFFINKFFLAKLISSRINPHFESIFAIGVDEQSWDDVHDASYDWPTIKELRDYRKQVWSVVNNVIDSIEISLPINQSSPMWTVIMGIEHERIHTETSSVLIRQLELRFVAQHKAFRPCTIVGIPPLNTMLPVSGGKVVLGKEENDPQYGWDNEYGHQLCYVPDFKASKYLVSNAEFLQFIDDGGYNKNQWWSTEGLSWRKYHNADKPEFWRGTREAYKLRLLTEEIPLPLNWPVEVCYLEADAFCKWKSTKTSQTIRMPDEAEYRRILEVSGMAIDFLDGSAKANWNMEHFASSCPIDQFGHGEFFDVVGNVWQWNETAIHAFDGFKVHPIYDDFSVPTFDTRHNLMKGGSWISAGNLMAQHSRYAFRRHFYQHSGFRYVVSDKSVQQKENTYETDTSVSQYCEFHYGESLFGVPNFSKAIAEIALDAMEGKPKYLALDIGCAVGRTSFELAGSFENVDAFDFSARFIRLGIQLQTQRKISYSRVEEGDLVSYHETSLKDLGLHGNYSNINFLQQDASNMKQSFAGYDLVAAVNLIDRLYDPVGFLIDIPTRMNKGGVLLIGSPYTWLEEYTKKENWLGGFKRNGKPIKTLDTLKSILGKHFTQIGDAVKVPFVIRETANKNQHSLSEVTLWEKM